ncbi:MAG: diadenylate cyclase [Planctomycetia bacterium]
MLALVLPHIAPLDVVEILVLWVAAYAALRFLRRSVAGGLFRGTGLLVWPLVMVLVAVLTALRLEVVGVLARGALPVLILGASVVFQVELRQAVARLGQSELVRRMLPRGRARADGLAVAEEVAAAAFQLRDRRLGAIVALERSTDLSGYVESGVRVDALLHKDLLTSLFQKEAALHDGAVIVRGTRIVAASCFLPLTEQPLDIAYGTRHRAALGLSEQSDALVIVTSEERGLVTLARAGQLATYRDAAALAADLARALGAGDGSPGVPGAPGAHAPAHAAAAGPAAGEAR